MVLVEGLALRVHSLVPAPGLGNHHEHGVRQFAPGHVQKLKHVIERGGVAAVFHHDRQDLLQVLAKQRRLAQGLARAHPVDVAAQCVDFAIVRDEAERVRQRPRREGVGRKTRVHQRQRRFHLCIAKIQEQALDLIRCEHALVHHRARRQARDIKQGTLGVVRFRDGILDALADDIKLALEGGFIRQRRSPADKDLPENRLGGARRGGGRGVVRGHIAPAQRRLSFLAHNRLKYPLAFFSLHFVAWQKHQARAVITRLRQQNIQLAAFAFEKTVRNLQQDTGAITGIDLAAAGAAMLQVLEDGQGLADDGVRLAPMHVDHKTDAAGIVFVGRFVQALSCCLAGLFQIWSPLTYLGRSRPPRCHLLRRLLRKSIKIDYLSVAYEKIAQKGAKSIQAVCGLFNGEPGLIQPYAVAANGQKEGKHSNFRGSPPAPTTGHAPGPRNGRSCRQCSPRRYGPGAWHLRRFPAHAICPDTGAAGAGDPA